MASTTTTQHAYYDSDDGDPCTIKLDTLTESVRYHVKRTYLASIATNDSTSSALKDANSRTCQVVEHIKTSSENDLLHVLVPDKPYVVTDKLHLVTEDVMPHVTTKENIEINDGNQTKDIKLTTKECHDEDFMVSVSSSGDEGASGWIVSGLANIDEELGLEASQGGEEVASIGDVSLEKIGDDLSDKEEAFPSVLYSKSNNSNQRKDGSFKTKSKKAKKRKRKGSEKVEEVPGGVDESSEKKPKRVAPNFFVAIQVSDPEIQNALQEVQKTVVSGDEKLKDAMVPVATLHLTIMVMHLATDGDVERAKTALRECNEMLSPRFERDGKLNIEFQGLGHFNNQVMFAKIKDEDEIVNKLYEIAEIVEGKFKSNNIVSTGERGFKPHLTVMKLSRAPSLRKKGVRRIKSELYKVHSNGLFGSQIMNGLQLCSINKPKSPEGYYYKAEEVIFGELGPHEIATITEEQDIPNELNRVILQEAPGHSDLDTKIKDNQPLADVQSEMITCLPASTDYPANHSSDSGETSPAQPQSTDNHLSSSILNGLDTESSILVNNRNEPCSPRTEDSGTGFSEGSEIEDDTDENEHARKGSQVFGPSCKTKKENNNVGDKFNWDANSQQSNATNATKTTDDVVK